MLFSIAFTCQRFPFGSTCIRSTPSTDFRVGFLARQLCDLLSGSILVWQWFIAYIWRFCHVLTFLIGRWAGRFETFVVVAIRSHFFFRLGQAVRFVCDWFVLPGLQLMSSTDTMHLKIRQETKERSKRKNATKKRNNTQRSKKQRRKERIQEQIPHQDRTRTPFKVAGNPPYHLTVLCLGPVSKTPLNRGKGGYF